jgi:hypothetical protein
MDPNPCTGRRRRRRSDQIKEIDMGGAFHMHRENEKCVPHIGQETSKEEVT